MGKIAQVAKLKFPLPKLDLGNWGVDLAWEKAIKNGRNWSEALADDIEDDEDRRLLLAAVKAGLIAADGVASGLVREDLKLLTGLMMLFMVMRSHMMKLLLKLSILDWGRLKLNRNRNRLN